MNTIFLKKRKTNSCQKKKIGQIYVFLLLEKTHFAAYQGFNLNVTEMVSLYCEWVCLISLYVYILVVLCFGFLYSLICSRSIMKLFYFVSPLWRNATTHLCSQLFFFPFSLPAQRLIFFRKHCQNQIYNYTRNANKLINV